MKISCADGLIKFPKFNHYGWKILDSKRYERNYSKLIQLIRGIRIIGNLNEFIQVDRINYLFPSRSFHSMMRPVDKEVGTNSII